MIIKKISILGMEYVIKEVKISETDKLLENQWSALCSKTKHEILLGDMEEEEYFGKMDEEEKKEYRKQTLRHEITHAFFNESGLMDNTHRCQEGWSQNEEMIDWIALQFPKMVKVFQECDCL
ncbi:hypothetical protein [Anaerosporobacter sp.]